MKFVDIRCPRCGETKIDHLIRDVDEGLPRCHAILEEYPGHGQLLTCQTKMERVYLPTNRGTVLQDSIEGGVELKNGLCNSDGTPRRYYSRSEIAKEAAKRGLTNLVTHIGAKGSDKSTKTSRWV